MKTKKPGSPEGIPIGDYPSRLVRFNIKANNEVYDVAIPINEVFRIREIFEEHVYSILLLGDHSKPMKIIDIGANIGLFALYMKCLNPESIIYCYEPSQSTFLLLKRNTSNIEGIHIRPYGLFNKDGTAMMYLDNENTGENSIKNIESMKKGVKREVTIQLREANSEFDNLDINSLNVLKIDTEGCEVDILENIKHRLDAVDYILLEYHSEKDRRTIDDILREFTIISAKATSNDLGQIKYVHSRLLPLLPPADFAPERPQVKIGKDITTFLLDFSRRYSNTLYNLLYRILPDDMNNR
jgi:FkbM family methyltransferase